MSLLRRRRALMCALQGEHYLMRNGVIADGLAIVAPENIGNYRGSLASGIYDAVNNRYKITVNDTSATYGAVFGALIRVDVTEYTRAYVTFAAQCDYSSSGILGIMCGTSASKNFLSTSGVGFVYGSHVSLAAGQSRAWTRYEMDISALTGEYYIGAYGFTGQGSKASGALYVSDISVI